MARKVLGYVELVWTCDSCQTKNPGAIRSCTACGAPQPIDVKFEHVDASTFNFIKDEALIRMAKSGPDKHCPYCGTRNHAETQSCVKCGGDLTVGATSRPSGDVITNDPVLAWQNDSNHKLDPTSRASGKQMPKWLPIVGILLLIICCVFGALYFSRMQQTESLEAVVGQAYWQRQIIIEEYREVVKNDWESDIPANASPYNCELRFRYNSDSYQSNAEEVCGEPYTIDTGTGVGEVVQDCYYKVYDEYCSYQIMQWVQVDTLTLDGYNTSPSWPTANLSTNQRQGNSNETYLITFVADGNEYPYRTSSLDIYQQATKGSHWLIEVNGFGDITSIKPDN